MSKLQRLSIAAVGGTYALLVVGGIVRATNSGLGCPDWPRCHGSLIPPADHHAWIEWTHRLTASVVGVIILALGVAAVIGYWKIRTISWAALLAVVMVGIQAMLGKETVQHELPAPVVMAHLALALAILALLIYIAVNAFESRRPLPARAGPPDRRVVPDYGFTILAAAAAVAVFVVLMTGAYVTGRHAGLVFTDWPLMNGQLIPDRGPLTQVHFAHRFLVAVVSVIVLGVAVQAWRWQRHEPAVVALATATVVLYLTQAIVGGAQVLSHLSTPWVVAHLAIGSAVWCAMVLLVLVSFYASRRRALAEVETPAERRTVGQTVNAYFQLTKPRIIELLLVTTVPTMVIAQRGWPPLWLVAMTVIGGAMAAGSANAFNCYFDRDIDAIMLRTKRRPIPSGAVSPERALEFAVILGLASFALLTVLVNLLSALLAMAALLFYVLIYTLWLKRSSDQNIVIGGAAGAVPPLVAWAAVDGRVGLPALILFALIFVWTPPHFWALAIRHSTDYRSANVPMLPVVRGPQETRRQILLYTVLTVAVALVLYPVAHMGVIYLVSALVLGALFIRQALKLMRDDSGRTAMFLFRYSITYLGMLFLMMVVDQLVMAYAL